MRRFAGMRRFKERAAALLIAACPFVCAELQADRAFAQSGNEVSNPAPPAAAPTAAASPPPPPSEARPGAPESAPAKKSALSAPVCSMRFLEAKVAGKLGGRRYADFRRDECGQKDTTAVFPTAISPKYANEKDADKARRLTCADQFTANKASNANGGLKWIESDGGYYGECVSRLKEG